MGEEIGLAIAVPGLGLGIAAVSYPCRLGSPIRGWSGNQEK